MSKKVAQAYLQLSHALAEMGEPPQCADPKYIEMFFVEPMPIGTPTSAAHRKARQDEIDAKLICDFCKVKELCAEYAIVAHENYGIFGGTTPADRKAIYAFARANKTGLPVIEQ